MSKKRKRRKKRKSYRPKRRYGICPECKVREGDSSKKELFQCPYCGRWFCKKHLKPRLALTRSYIEKIKDPVLKDRIYKEWEKEGGHPDWQWTEKYLKEIEKEEEEKRENLFEVLEKEKITTPPKPTTSIPIPEVKPIGGHVKINVKLPRFKVKKIVRNPIFWYTLYFSLTLYFIYLTVKNQDLYFFLIPYFQYPLYILSLFLGFYIPYRLFRKFETKEPTSDLQLWFWKILSGLVAGISAIILFFGITFFFSAIISKVGSEIGYSLSIFLGSLFLGLMLFSAYLLFKFKIRSGIIIHRGIW